MPGGRIPHSVLPPAEMDTAHLIQLMISYQTVAKIYVVFVLLIGVGTQVTVHQLDKATANQCANHDWPVDKHQVHMAWCAANGYQTN